MTDSATPAFSDEPGEIRPTPPQAIARLLGSPEGSVLIDVDEGTDPVLISREELTHLASQVNLSLSTINVLKAQYKAAVEGQSAIMTALSNASQTDALLAKANHLLADTIVAGDKLFNALLGIQPGLQEYTFEQHGMGYIAPADEDSYLDHAVAAIDAWAKVAPE